MITLSVVLAVYLLSLAFSPFPYWSTYLVLWKQVLFDRNADIGKEARIRQARFLIRYVILSPVWTLLWYLDEVLFPDYKRQSVRPLFIIGQPRSGTTLLHRTLASDEETFLAVRHIEWRYPYIIVQKLIEAFGLSRRIQETCYWPNTETGERARRMHPNTLYDYEEDGIFYEECFLHHLFIFLRFPYPDLIAFLDDFPSLPEPVRCRMLVTHRKVIKKISYLRGNGSRYLSKEVTSHNKIPELLKLYPDAEFILVVRPASEFMSSLLALVRQSTKAKTSIDPVTIHGWEQVFVQCMRDNSRLLIKMCEQEVDRDLIHVSFSGLSSDIPKTVRYIYHRIGSIVSEGYIEHLEDLKKRQMSREKGYRYRLHNLEGFEQYDQFVSDVENRFRSAMYDFDRLYAPHSHSLEQRDVLQEPVERENVA